MVTINSTTYGIIKFTEETVSFEGGSPIYDSYTSILDQIIKIKKGNEPITLRIAGKTYEKEDSDFNNFKKIKDAYIEGAKISLIIDDDLQGSLDGVISNLTYEDYLDYISFTLTFEEADYVVIGDD